MFPTTSVPSYHLLLTQTVTHTGFGLCGTDGAKSSKSYFCSQQKGCKSPQWSRNFFRSAAHNRSVAGSQTVPFFLSCFDQNRDPNAEMSGKVYTAPERTFPIVCAAWRYAAEIPMGCPPALCCVAFSLIIFDYTTAGGRETLRHLNLFHIMRVSAYSALLGGTRSFGLTAPHQTLSATKIHSRVG